eukprot:scaffold5770_cov388-Prasinococcus_capsulatus_cf.AAC.13
MGMATRPGAGGLDPRPTTLGRDRGLAYMEDRGSGVHGWNTTVWNTPSPRLPGADPTLPPDGGPSSRPAPTAALARATGVPLQPTAGGRLTTRRA